MKKILTLFSFTLFLAPLSLQAAVLFSQSITLQPGWNLVSTPRILESHEFSLPETTENFDVFVLNASSTSSWSTLSDIGQTEFMPLYGYFINNKSAVVQTLTFNYKADVEPNDRLFERTFTKTGWYSVGVANATYAKAIDAANVDSNNPSRVLSSLSGNYDSAIDVTDDSFATTPGSVKVGATWKQGVASDVDSLNDVRETKGYLVYIRTAGALYSGFQNNDAPIVTPPTPVATLPTLAITSGFSSTTTPNNTLRVKIASFTFTNSSTEDVTLNNVSFNPVLNNPLSSNLGSFSLEIDSVASPLIPFTLGTTTIGSFNITVPPSGIKTIDIYTDFGPTIDEVVTTALEINYTSVVSTITRNISAAGVSITSVDGSPAPAVP